VGTPSKFASYKPPFHCGQIIRALRFNVWGLQIKWPYINNNLHTTAVFVDVERAFDINRHTCLSYKQSELRFSAIIVKFINSFLSNRTFRVTVEGNLSTRREKQGGVPQGSVLTPTRYTLYLNNTHPSPNPRGPRSPFSRWHASLRDRLQRSLWSHFNGVVMWALEHRSQRR